MLVNKIIDALLGYPLPWVNESSISLAELFKRDLLDKRVGLFIEEFYPSLSEF